MRVLGIETSCDETAAALVINGQEVISEIVLSQVDVHAEYGGVIPEVAARHHIEAAIPVIDQCLQAAAKKLHVKNPWDVVDAIAVTHGPGLPGALLVGTLTAKTLAWLHQKPLVGVNHVIGHTYANWLDKTDYSPFPLLAATFSGNHAQIMLYRSHYEYDILGETRDDAIGEAFDKVAKILGLPYPGGPEIARVAVKGDPTAYTLPISRLDNPYDFSFSGLKTAVLRLAQAEAGQDYRYPSFKLAPLLSAVQIANIAASFQATAVETVVRALKTAEVEFRPKTVVIGGGAAANQLLRQELQHQLKTEIDFISPSRCTDNAAMIAARGFYELEANNGISPHQLSTNPSLRA